MVIHIDDQPPGSPVAKKYRHLIFTFQRGFGWPGQRCPPVLKASTPRCFSCKRLFLPMAPRFVAGQRGSLDVPRDAPYDYYNGDLTTFILGSNKAMQTNVCGMVLSVAVPTFSLAGCGCFIQARKGEAPPPKPPEEKIVIAPEQKQEVMVPPAAPVPAPVVAAVPGLSNVYFDFDRYNIKTRRRGYAEEEPRLVQGQWQHQGKDRRELRRKGYR